MVSTLRSEMSIDDGRPCAAADIPLWTGKKRNHEASTARQLSQKKAQNNTVDIKMTNQQGAKNKKKRGSMR